MDCFEHFNRALVQPWDLLIVALKIINEYNIQRFTQEVTEDQPGVLPQSPVTTPTAPFVPSAPDPVLAALGYSPTVVGAPKKCPLLKEWIVEVAKHALEECDAKSAGGFLATTEPPSFERRTCETVGMYVSAPTTLNEKKKVRRKCLEIIGALCTAANKFVGVQPLRTTVRWNITFDLRFINNFLTLLRSSLSFFEATTCNTSDADSNLPPKNPLRAEHLLQRRASLRIDGSGLHFHLRTRKAANLTRDRTNLCGETGRPPPRQRAPAFWPQSLFGVTLRKTREWREKKTVSLAVHP